MLMKIAKLAGSVLGVAAVSIVAMGAAQRGPAWLKNFVDPDGK